VVNRMSPEPTTAIIGAGISGLTTGKMLRDYRLPYTCFELSDRIGGNWAFGNPNGKSSAYRSLHIDTSKHQLSFKDFPMPEDYPDFPHHTQIKDYLDRAAARWRLGAVAPGRQQPPVRQAGGRQRAPLGPAHGRVPRHLLR
jgi:cation diffusion facilitator CzcD-associated flavoprotein CzcO